MVFEVKVEKAGDIAVLERPKVEKGLQERNELLAKVFEEAGDDYDPSKVTVVEFPDGVKMAEYIRNITQEIDEFGKRQSHFDAMDAAKGENQRRLQKGGESRRSDARNFAGKTGEDRPVAAKGFGDVIAQAEEVMASQKAKQQREFFMADFDAKAWLEQKAVFETGAGWAPETTRTGRLVLSAQREIEVTDILPVFPTTQAAIVYMEETTFTNAAAERAEGGAYVESAIELTERSVTVRSVGTSLPMTDEQLDDVPGAEAYLNTRLGFMVRQKLDSQILVGDGTPPALLGTLHVGSIGSQAKGADNIPDAVYKGIVKCRVTGRAQPNAVIAHPSDWQDVRLLKTSDGVYIWGSPSEAGPARIWGLPVVETTAVTENTMIVGDYARFSGLHVRKGLEVQTGYVNDDFTDGRKTIRAGLRVAVVHYRPAAFCQVTGV